MSTLRDWAELLRVSALFTVPGDAVAGAVAAGMRPDGRTLRAIGCSLCLYEAGMVLNDWADRDEDARERPHRPLPSGRIRPATALGAAFGLTGAGVALAASTGRPAALVSGALAATVWAYDLWLKHTSAGPLAMGVARGLDVLLGATAAGGRISRRAVGASSVLLAAHTLAVTHVARNETTGGSSRAPLAALVTTCAIGTLVAMPVASRRAGASGCSGLVRPGCGNTVTALAATYAAASSRPLLHASLNPSPPLTQRAVGGGIRALIPLQAALVGRFGAPVLGAALMAGVPLARRVARKVSPT
ncbi:SCO3242 family prenyltransferase [Streptomyces javensis]|uniref:UbiA family prenyltransferase n=1 Tax=Streptomyces javensis TaxID=114698 RepID=A0ABN1WZL2_9ACTN